MDSRGRLVRLGWKPCRATVVLKAKTDPEGAPLPPHATLSEARSFMSAMVKRDRGSGSVIGTPQDKSSTGGLAKMNESIARGLDARIIPSDLPDAHSL